VASSNPLQRGFRGCGIFIHQNHAAGGENDSIMVEMFVCLCLASQKPSEREFFVPARTDLGVKLLKKLVLMCAISNLLRVLMDTFIYIRGEESFNCKCLHFR